MIYFAHRGASASAMANSVEAFKLARQQGASCYELDVHLTRDKQLLVHHDDTLQPAGRAGTKIGALTLQQARDFFGPLNAMQVAFPAVLADIIPVVRPKLNWLNIEIKNEGNIYPGIESVLWQTLQAQAADLLEHILVSSFDYSTLERFHMLAPQIKIGWLTRQFDSSLMAPIHAYSVHMNQTRLTAEIIRQCHAAGRRIFVYTVNTRAEAQRLEQMGVDGIFTDCPELFY